MFCRSVFKDLHHAFRFDPFWPITYFSWLYYYWTGSSVIHGIIFSGFIIVMHLACWLLIYGKFLVDIAKRTQNDVYTSIIYYSTMVIQTLMIPFLVTVWMIRGQRRVHSVISSIAIVDEKLSKFGQCPSRNSTVWKMLILTCFPLVLIGGFILYDMDNLVQFNGRVTRAMWLSYGRWHELVVLYTQGLFACLALVLGDRYRAVNSMLKKISEEYNCDLRNSRRLYFDWIIAIQELRAVNRKLYFAAEKISEAFGIQLLIIAIFSLFTTIGDLYKFYLTNVSHCDPGVPHAAEYILWGLMHVSPLCTAGFCCSWTCAQEKYTAVLLQEMTVSDEHLRMEISTFSLQLIHYDLHFSACGFYNIDLSLIQGIIGTVATYLVILIQLRTVPHDCRNSSIQVSENISNFFQ